MEEKMMYEVNTIMLRLNTIEGLEELIEYIQSEIDAREEMGDDGGD